MTAESHTPDILVVDDNPNNLGLLSDMLQQRGYHVRVANSGRRALDEGVHLIKKPFTLVQLAEKLHALGLGHASTDPLLPEL